MGNYHDQGNETNQIPHLHKALKADGDVITPPPRKFEYSILRAQVDEIIAQGFNDMWLLIDGEEMDYSNGIWRDGKAFAMVTGDQISLLGPRFSAVNALLSVGISIQEA